MSKQLKGKLELITNVAVTDDGFEWCAFTYNPQKAEQFEGFAQKIKQAHIRQGEKTWDIVNAWYAEKSPFKGKIVCFCSRKIKKEEKIG